MKLFKKFFPLAVLLPIIFPTNALAVCPVCTVAVGAGVGLSRYFGIDDTITGLWIGGFTVSMIMWTINWMNKKNYRFYGRKIIITVSYYLLIVVPLQFTNIMGHPYNKILGIDKLLFGIIIGSIIFLIGAISYNIVKKRNDNKAHFPFERVAFPVGSLVIFSFIFYFITNNG